MTKQLTISPRKSRYDNQISISPTPNSNKLIPYRSKNFEPGELKEKVEKGPEIGPNETITLPMIKHNTQMSDHVKIEKLDIDKLNAILTPSNVKGKLSFYPEIVYSFYLIFKLKFHRKSD
jgi:hypothetical protein